MEITTLLQGYNNYGCFGAIKQGCNKAATRFTSRIFCLEKPVMVPCFSRVYQGSKQCGYL